MKSLDVLAFLEECDYLLFDAQCQSVCCG